MPPTFSMPAELTEEAKRIFFIVDSFLKSTSTQKPSPALESFPPSFGTTPWRRLYIDLGAHSIAYLTMKPWDPSELSVDSARGIFWFFTELPRMGEKICRKTVDGRQTWSGRSGRAYRNGFPRGIRVAKHVITGMAYHMLELTLDEDKPAVSLCKIWRKGIAAAKSSPQTMSQGTPTSDQVEENLEEAAEMQIDQPQGQFEGTEQLHMPNHEVSMIDYTMHRKSTEGNCSFPGQLEGKEQHPHVPGHTLSTSDYIVHPYFTVGQFESLEQELQMPDQAISASDYIVSPNSIWGQLEGIEEQVKMHEDALLGSGYIVLPNFTKGFIPSTGQDDDSVYKSAVSYLYEKKESFKQIVLYEGNEAHEIASKAQSLASAMRNLLNRFTSLGINTEPASNTTNSNKLPTATNIVTEQASMQVPEMTTEDGCPEQERPQQQMEGCSINEDYVYLDDFISLQRGAGTDYYDQGLQ